MAARRSLRESYSLLGLPESASEDEVRRSYKLKARECHPDKNPDDPEATRKFQELGEAYHRIQAGEDEDDDFPGGIDPFVVFFHAMRMQQLMRDLFYAQFADSEDEYIFVGPFGFPRSEFERRRSRHSEQYGYSRFNSSSSWRNHQQRSSWEERRYTQADKSESEGFSRTAKHKRKKNYSSRSDDYESYYQPKGSYREGERKEERSQNSASWTNQRESTTSSKSGDTKQPFPVRKPGQSNCQFPQVKPKKKSKKQQMYEEWRRQQEVADNMKKEGEVTERGSKKDTSSGNVAEPTFPEEPNVSKNSEPPEANPSPVRRVESVEDDSYDKGSPAERNSSEAPPTQTTLRSQRDRRKHYGKSERFCEHRAKVTAMGKDELTEPTDSGSHNQTAENMNEEPGDAKSEQNLPFGIGGDENGSGIFEDKSGSPTPDSNTKKTHNRRKKIKGATKEREVKPDVLQSGKARDEEKETREEEDGGKANMEKLEPGQTLAGDGTRKLRQEKINPQIREMDAVKPRIIPQKGRGNIGRNLGNPTDGAHANKCQSGEHAVQGESPGTNRNGQAKFASSGQSGETNGRVTQRSKSRTRWRRDLPDSRTHQMQNKQNGVHPNNKQKLTNEEGGPCRPQFAASTNSQTEQPVFEPQAYRKPPLESAHDKCQWKTAGSKRRARRDRKWSAQRAQYSAPHAGVSMSPEVDFWDSVMSPDEGPSVASLVPLDELDEQRQLEIALELSKQQL